jgi:hypothetical protein
MEKSSAQAFVILFLASGTYTATQMPIPSDVFASRIA